MHHSFSNADKNKNSGPDRTPMDRLDRGLPVSCLLSSSVPYSDIFRGSEFYGGEAILLRNDLSRAAIQRAT